MQAQRLTRYAAALGVAASLLAGCGGSPPSISAPGALPQSRTIAQHAAHGKSWMLPEAKREDLIYAAGTGVIDVFTFPKGKYVGSLPNLNVRTGICSDPKGNVFVPVPNSPSDSTIYEFVHGGTIPIATLSDPGGATSCSFDTNTGNLAVANDGPNVAIFEKAKGDPTIINTSTVPAYFCAYDNAGNLFVDNGYDSQALGELPVGEKSFKEVTLNVGLYPMSLQWDKDHLAVAGYTFNPNGPQPFYNVSISGSDGIVSGPIMLAAKNGKHIDYPVQFFLKDKTMMGPAPHGGGANLIDFWKYPVGGNPIKTISHRNAYHGGAVSLAPHG